MRIDDRKELVSPAGMWAERDTVDRIRRLHTDELPSNIMQMGCFRSVLRKN